MSSAAPTTAGGRLRLLSGQPEQRELHLFPPRAGGGGRRPRRRRASLGQVPPQPHAVGAAGGHPPRHAHVLVVVRRLPPPPTRRTPAHTPRPWPTHAQPGWDTVRAGWQYARHPLASCGGGVGWGADRQLEAPLRQEHEQQQECHQRPALEVVPVAWVVGEVAELGIEPLAPPAPAPAALIPSAHCTAAKDCLHSP
jgi:hypothetical protein